DAAGVIFYVFLVGAAFTVVERTGALGRLVQWLVGRLANRDPLVIPLASIVFSLGGILIQMQEELIAFVPMLLLLTRRLGYRPLVACAISLGVAAVGGAFSPVNPLPAVLRRELAEVQSHSGVGCRMAR